MIELMFFVGLVSTGLVGYFIGFDKGYKSALNEMVDLSNKIKETILRPNVSNTNDLSIKEEYNRNQLN
jgi:hypothetical protein